MRRVLSTTMSECADEPETVEFPMGSDNKKLRKQINNIIQSYANPWDVLTELAQNSVDSIRRYGEDENHKVIITIDKPNKGLRIIDTGTGFEPDKLIPLLAPDSTDKELEDGSVGEKGVGLTFCTFISNEIIIHSKNELGEKKVKVEGCNNWRKSNEDEKPPKIQILSNDTDLDLERFTDIQINDIHIEDGALDVFSLSPQSLLHFLQAYSSLGDCHDIFGLDAIKFKTYYGPSLEKIKLVNTRYSSPLSVLPKSKIYNLDAYKEKAGGMNDKKKNQTLDGKVVYSIRNYKGPNDRDIRVLMCFAPNPDLYLDISKTKKIFKIDKEKEGFESYNKATETLRTSSPAQSKKLLREYGLFEPAIYVGTKGMPTSVKVEPPRVFGDGYWRNMWVLVMDDKVEFDMGRKSIPSRLQSTLKKFVKQSFQEFIALEIYKHTKAYSPGFSDTSITSAEWNAIRAKQFAEYKDLEDLEIEGINFMKKPKSGAGQEASVVSIFHEMLVAGHFKRYRILQEGYQMQYDAWGIYTKDDDTELDIIIEYKYDAKGLIGDMEAGRKLFSDIDILVCWTMSEAKLSKQMTIESVDDEHANYEGQTHIISIPIHNALPDLPVICLEEFIKRQQPEEEVEISPSEDFTEWDEGDTL